MTDGRKTTYSEREREFKFAKKDKRNALRVTLKYNSTQ